MRLERDVVRAPPLDVAPGEVCEPSPAVGYVPSIHPAGEIRDHEARRGEPHVPQDGERVVTKTAVGVVERDEELAISRSPLAANASRELGERYASPAGGGQRVHLHRETPWGDARDAELAAPFNLVVAEDRRNHDAVRSKPRAVERSVWGQTPVLPNPPAPRVLCSSSVASTSSGVS